MSNRRIIRRSRPMPDAKTYLLKLPKSDFRSVKRVAHKRGMSVADFIRRAIAEQLVELRDAA